jgi:hypothetical protein
VLANGLAGKLDAEAKSVSAALGGKLACASIPHTPLPLLVQLRLAYGGQQLKVLKSASPLAIQKLQWQLSRRENEGYLALVLPPRPAPCGPHSPPPWGRQSRRSLLRIQLQRVKDVGL